MAARTCLFVASCLFFSVAVVRFILMYVEYEAPATMTPGYNSPDFRFNSLLPNKHYEIPPQDLAGHEESSVAKRDIHTCTRWMYDNRNALSEKSLLHVTLPGTHDSATFRLNKRIMPGSLPWPWIQLLETVLKAGIGYVVNWSRSQTADLHSQLQHGIRFLDFRAGWNGSHWVSCHTTEGTEMEQLFQTIDSFLNDTSHEMVVMELRDIYNADDSQRAQLATMMNITLGHHMAPCCSLDRPLKDFWEDGRRLVVVSSLPCNTSHVPVGYDRGDCPWWEPDSISSPFPDTDNKAVMWFWNKALLETYSPNGTLFKMSWTLTPHITTLIHGLVSYPNTLLQLADSANHLLPDFFDAAIAEGKTNFPQVLVTDHFQSAYLVPMITRINRIQACLGADPS